MSITVYKSEIEDGLAKAIQNCNSIAYNSVAKSALPRKIEKSFSFANNGVNLQDEDLFFLDAILASVGLNGNDDYFLQEETWAARNSAVHKQFNFMHNQTDIIGHIFASNVFDISSKLIPDDTSFDDVPEFFDIVTSSVLYKAWPQDELQERMDKICEEIPQGKWFVSMECLFRNFDYALAMDNGAINIIQRKKETSFLTKHLRAFGGSGIYNGQKLSRVLRRYSFNGKGLVDNPANKRSIIFDNIERLKTYSIAFNGEKQMSKETTELVATELKTGVDFSAMLAKANEENDKLRQALEDKSKAELASAKAKFDSDLATANDLVKAKDTEIESLKTQVTEALAQAKLHKDKSDEINTALASLKEENKKQERINKLVSAGVKDGVNDIVTKWSNASDEQFNDIVNLYSASKKTDEKKEDETDKDESAEAAAKAIEEDKVETDDKEVALASNQNADEEEKRLMTSASNWLGSILNSTKKNKGE